MSDNKRKSFLRFATIDKRAKILETRKNDEDECLKQLEIITEEISDLSADNVRLTGQLKIQGLEFDKLKMIYLDDMKSLRSDNDRMVTKIRNLEFENENMVVKLRSLESPESGWVCTDPYDPSDYTKHERINSCKKETGGVFDNKVKVPGGRFTNQAKCTETCYDK